MRMQTLLCTLLFLCLSAPTCSQWNVECDRSASGVSYTPHDNRRQFNPTSVSLGINGNFLRKGLGTGQDETPVYIYPVNTTSAECISTLVAIQFCYVRTEVSDQHSLHTVATFLALDQDDSGVTAYQEFPLQSNETSDGANCTSVEGTFFCCIITNLSNSQQFSIPSSPSTPFAFGLVVNRSSDVQLVSFNSSTNITTIDAYQVSSYTRGQRFVLAEESGVQLDLPFIRLGIATDGLTTPEDPLSTTTSADTQEEDSATDGLTTPEDTLGTTTSADIPMTTTPKAVLSTVTSAQPATTTRLPNDPATTSPPSASEVFQCQPSSDQSGQVYTPNIPDFYFDPSNVATGESDRSLSPNFPSTSSTRRAVYIFPIPIESECSGTVVAIQYCYSGRESDLNSLFTVVQNFLALDGNGTRRNSNTLIESVPSNDKCVASSGRIHCCDTMHLRQEQQFEIPPTPVPFAFGLRINRNSDGQLLTFSDIFYDYVVNGYQETLPLSQPVVFTNPIQLGLPVLRLLIDLERTPNSTMTGSNEQTMLATIGAAVAGSLLFLLVAVIIGVALLLHVRIRRKNKLRGKTRSESVNPMYRNVAVSEGNTTLNAYGGVIVDYAGTGPAVSYRSTERPRQNSPEACEQTYEYAYSKRAAYEMGSSYADLDSDSTTEEVIYVAPARDMGALYEQLQRIRANTVERSSVKLDDKIGTGQFGTVYKGVLDSGGGEVEVAVKTLKEGSGEEDRVKFLQEVAIMGQFKHHNVVEVYGVVTIGEPILLVLELLCNGDLRNYLHERRNPQGNGVDTDDHTLLSYCRQVASGMAYLSNKAFVHRDLAARNILVSDDDVCKIADFGMSRDLMDESYYVSHGGMIPVKWTAPEALHYKKYSTASDVWSYGALMYEIWSVGHKPFEGMSNTQVLREVDGGFRLPPPPGCPRELYQLMIMCWHPDASERPNFQELIKGLSLTDTKLLKWSEEDKSAHSEAAHLGADLHCGEELYKDLQTCYKE